ncbi:hypothetical protein BH20ACI4_BH20ACI4_30440 [soil metagenome]
MAKLSSTSNKAKTSSSSNGCNNSAKNNKTGTSKTTAHRGSVTGKFVNGNKSENSISKADELTLRAWKKTFENRKKAA